MVAPNDVQFPIVVLGKAVLASLRVERMPLLDRTERFAAGHDRPEALDVLMDARAVDPLERRLDGVLIRFMRRDFNGVSFGLALALADKRARFPIASGGRLIATGEVLNGGEGRIGPIEGFEAKALTVLAACDDGGAPVTFAFPGENWRTASADIRERLTAMGQDGRLTLLAADQLDALSSLWDAPASAPPVASRRRPLVGILAILVILAIMPALVWGGWRLHGQPLRRCEAALDALEPAQARKDARLVAAAVDVCALEARTRPNDGRLLFLTGQAHALNGSPVLADKYWSRSAQAGDRNGLAVWGRRLWLSAPTDPKVVAEAMRNLQRASDLGSPAAMEDMADIYTEGRGAPADLDKAQALLVKARDLRRRSAR